MLSRVFVFLVFAVSAEYSASSSEWMRNLHKISAVLVANELETADTDPVDEDPCHNTYHDQDKCDADKTMGGGCVWCKCRALPSSCWTIANSKHLPSAVFKCDDVQEIQEPEIHI